MMGRAVERADPGRQAIFTGQRPRLEGGRAEAIAGAVFRDRWRILAAMAAVLAATGLVELAVAPVSTAQAELLVLPQPGEPAAAALRNEIDILRSRPLAASVVASIGPRRLYPDLGPGPAFQHYMNSLVVTGDGSGVIVVGFSHPDPAIATQVANRVIADYLALRARLYDNDRVRSLAAQLAALRSRQDAAQQAYAGFTAAHGSRFETGLDILLHRKDSLQQDRDAASLAMQQDAARAGPDAPRPDRLRAQQDLAMARQRLDLATGRLAEVQGAIADLEAQEPVFQRLRQQRDLAASSYRAAAQALDQTSLDATLRSDVATVRVIEPAETPPVSHRLRLLILAAGVLLSLLAGTATAFLCAIFRRGFGDPGRMERELGLPVLTVIQERHPRGTLPALERDPGS